MLIIDEYNQEVKEERFLEELNQRIRNVIEAENGEIYISTDSGNIYLLTNFEEK